MEIISISEIAHDLAGNWFARVAIRAGDDTPAALALAEVSIKVPIAELTAQQLAALPESLPTLLRATVDWAPVNEWIQAQAALLPPGP